MSSKNFDLAIHNFRAIAIFSVVMIHCVCGTFFERVTSITQENKFLFNMIYSTLFQGATLLFIFISGYLTYMLFKETSYINFIRKKFFNLMIPYFIITSIILLINHIIHYLFDFYMYGIPSFLDIKLIFFTYCFGWAQGQLWYIPYIFVIFIFTPLILKLKKDKILFIAITLSILPIIFPREFVQNYKVEGFSILQWQIIQYCYFTPTFLLGMIYYIYKDKILEIIYKNINIIVSMYILSALSYFIKPYIFGGYGNHAVLYINKLLLISILFYILNKYTFKNKIFTNIANLSFGIYFVHFFVIDRIHHIIINYICFNSTITAQFLSLIISSIICFSMSYFICVIIRKIFKKRSRFIIGC